MFPIDITQVLLWQYNNAPKLQQLITDKQTWIDDNVSAFLESYYQNIFDARTANDFGLEVWAIILGIDFPVTDVDMASIFGFDVGYQNFVNGNFFPYGSAILTAEQKRIIVMLMYLKYVSNGTIDDVAKAIQSLYPTAIALDNMDMTITLAIGELPSNDIEMILDTYDIMPRPAGVKLLRLFDYDNWFAFDGQNGQNFENGYFGA